MKIFIRIFFGALTILPVISCTTKLEVEKYADREPANGAMYNLLVSEFTINVKYRITGCPLEAATQKGKFKEVGDIPGLTFEVAADLSHKTRSDKSETYVINYSSLQSPTKKYDLEVNFYDSGMVKSIKTSAKDETGEIIVSVAGSAAKLALANTAGAPGLIALGSLSAKTQSKSQDEGELVFPLNVCKPAVRDALLKIDGEKENEKALLKEADQEKEKVIKIRAALVDAGGATATDPALKVALKKLADAYAAYWNKKTEVEKLDNLLTIEKSFKHIGISSESFSLTETNLSKWFINKDTFHSEFKKLNPGVTEPEFFDILLPSIAGNLQLKFEVDGGGLAKHSPKVIAQPIVDVGGAIAPAASHESSSSVHSSKGAHSFNPPVVSSSASSRMAYEGLVYRQPWSGSARLCLRDQCGEDKYLQSKDFAMPDGGPLAILPFKNGPFEENGFEADFSELGALTRVKVFSASVAKEQAKTLENLASLKLDYNVKRAQVAKAEKDNAIAEAKSAAEKVESDLKKQHEDEIDNLTHQITLLTKQKDLAALTKAPEVDEELVQLKKKLILEKLKNELSTLDTDNAEAELDRITAEQAIEELLNKR